MAICRIVLLWCVSDRMTPTIQGSVVYYRNFKLFKCCIFIVDSSFSEIVTGLTDFQSQTCIQNVLSCSSTCHSCTHATKTVNVYMDTNSHVHWDVTNRGTDALTPHWVWRKWSNDPNKQHPWLRCLKKKTMTCIKTFHLMFQPFPSTDGSTLDEALCIKGSALRLTW